MERTKYATRVWALAACFLLPSAFAFAKQPAAPKLPKGVGRLWNISSEPFTFQLGITSGSGWSEPITLAPGKYREIRRPTPGQTSEIAGLRDRVPCVKIQTRQPIGLIRISLPAQTPDGETVPQWFYVKDSNGFGRMVQAETVEQAQARQAELQRRPRMSPEEIERIKEVLRANYVLFD
jgi:hypothetical protein